MYIDHCVEDGGSSLCDFADGLRGFNSIWPWGCGFMSFDMNVCKLNGSRFIIDLFVFRCLFHQFEGIAMLWFFFPRIPTVLCQFL